MDGMEYERGLSWGALSGGDSWSSARESFRVGRIAHENGGFDVELRVRNLLTITARKRPAIIDAVTKDQLATL